MHWQLATLALILLGFAASSGRLEAPGGSEAQWRRRLGQRRS